MTNKVLKIHDGDNVLVALTDLGAGETVNYGLSTLVTRTFIPAKHKLIIHDLAIGGEVIMYGVLVGRAVTIIRAGELLTTENIRHASSDFLENGHVQPWIPPDTNIFKACSFNGYHRNDGEVGTANYWLIIPLVFCENRNIEVLQEALLRPLGYARKNSYEKKATELVDKIKGGASIKEILFTESATCAETFEGEKLFKHIDGIKFLNHNGGCGGGRQDAETLCGLLAGYITHANVAGATVLSLGCQNAQAEILKKEIARRSPQFDKPLYILDQQSLGKESILLDQAIRQTLAGLMLANESIRRPAPLSKLTIGLECGGSDGFSGISANPAIGFTSDLLVGLGAKVILAEFPELCGVEQNLINRCTDQGNALRFMSLMRTYSQRADQAGSGFEMNPSPGNIKDGLITDAMKSAGAAKKGGTSPVVAVLDYPEKAVRPGLNLLCTPGNDVESTTAEVGSGANIVLFTTGLGTPTGNPIVPVIKIASNTNLFNRMNDIIDLNTGTIIEGSETIEQAGIRILDYIIKVASGEVEVSAVRHGQNDFIPWKRGISL